MAAFENVLQMPKVKVRVNSRGRDVGVPKQFLDVSQVAAIFEQVSCEAVSKEMGINAFIEAGQSCELCHEALGIKEFFESKRR